jgi:hypothetical protein
MDVLEHTLVPLTIKDIWKQVAMDMEKQMDLVTLLQGLLEADKIQKVGNGFMPKRKVKVNKAAMAWVDFKLLEPFGIFM